MAATTTAFEAEILAATQTFGDPINLIPNPSFEINTAQWGQVAASGSFARVTTDGSVGGSTSLRQTNPGTNTGEGARTNSVDVAASTTYTATVYLKGALGGESYLLILKERDAADAAIAETQVPVVLTRDWQAFSVTRAFGATGVKAAVHVRSNTVVASAFFIDALILTAGAAPVPYFDGDTPGYAWTGARHASTSRSVQALVYTFQGKDRGLMAGAALKLRQHYLAGITDPAAHTLAKNNPKQLKALTDTGKLASFDAITAP